MGGLTANVKEVDLQTSRAFNSVSFIQDNIKTASRGIGIGLGNFEPKMRKINEISRLLRSRDLR